MSRLIITVIALVAILSYCQGAQQPPEKLSYEDHACNRDCLTQSNPMVCEYNFTIEHYQTFSHACYNCPSNHSDCFRPHCISADGGVRAVKVVNRMMPGPAINVCKGDMINVNVYNEQQDGEGTTIHWHGILQHDTPFMDGVPMVTQCPIHSRTFFQYRFLARDTGTHYWHAHSGMQRTDGVFGAVVVRDTISTMAQTHYDLDLPEHTVLVHEWFSQYTSTSFTLHHHGLVEDEVSSILINGRGSTIGHDDVPDEEGHARVKRTSHETVAYKVPTPHSVFSVTRGQRYRFRFISNGIINCPLKVYVENHNISVIASDGNDLDKVDVESFTILGGERYDVVVSADQPVGNYWIYVVGLEECSDDKIFGTAILRYEGAQNVVPTSMPTYEAGVKPTKDANTLHVTADALTVAKMTSMFNNVARILSMDVKRFYVNMEYNDVQNYRYYDSNKYSLATVKARNPDALGDSLYAIQLNRITFESPTSPLLTQYDDIPEEMFCNETSVQKECRTEFCGCIHRIKVAIGDVVELVLISEGLNGDGNHPMHLHGHSFFVLGMEKLNATTTRGEVESLDANGNLQRNLVNPVLKDTVMVPDGGYTVIRFLADNPGFWFFHCHVQFHLTMGMAFVLQTGETHQMPQPPGDFPRCGNWRFTSGSSQHRNCPNSAMSNGIGFMLVCVMFFISRSVLRLRQ